MRKTALTIALALLLTTAFACSNWSRYTPGNLDNRAIQAEIEKNIAADGLTGIVHVDSVTGDGTVTLTGTVKNSGDRQKAYDDAAKVNGVKSVNNQIKVGS